MLVNVYKDDTKVEEDSKVYQQKNVLFVGKDDDMDVIATHGSVSRMHAVVLVDQKRGLCIIDLMTSNGTKIGEDKLVPFVPHSLPENLTSPVTLGASTRCYVFGLDAEAHTRRKEALYSKVANYQAVAPGNKAQDDTTVFVGKKK